EPEPRLVHDRVCPQPDHRRLGPGGASPRIRVHRSHRNRLARARLTSAAAEDDPDMKLWPVVSGVARRTLKHALTNPQIVLPTMLFPLFFFTAFAGGLSQLRHVPGFDFPPGYTAFQFVFVLLQSAAFSGVFTGFGVARDFETGFTRRLLLAAPNRTGLVLGYAIASAVRWLITASIITAVAFAVGMQVGGNGVDLFGL